MSLIKRMFTKIKSFIPDRLYKLKLKNTSEEVVLKELTRAKRFHDESKKKFAYKSLQRRHFGNFKPVRYF